MQPEWLRSMVHRALEESPEIRVDRDAFSAFVAAKGEGAPDPAHLHTGDLLLAFAAVQQEPHALARLERQLRELPQMLAKLRLDDAALSDTVQDVRAKLLLADGERTPKLLEYSGRGALGAWLRTVAVRTAISSMRTQTRRRESSFEDLAVRASSDDPELSAAKDRYREPFQLAFRSALQALSSRERNVLRMYLLDGRNIEEIGKVYGVHRATVARWIADTRQALAKTTRDAMTGTVDATSAEFRSITRLCFSQVDVSLHTLLQSAERPVSSR